MPGQLMSFSRRFQMWRYAVGHGQLLLRSTKDPDFSTRVDVLFKNVAAIHLPTILAGMTVSDATDSEKSELNLQIDPSRLEGRKIFVVRGSNYLGYVVAGNVASHEDDRDYHEPSHFSILPVDQE